MRPDLRKRCRQRLAMLHVAETLDDLRFPGSGLHKLQGKPERWAIKVSGPWRITFEWDDGEAVAVDLEQVH